MPSLTPVTSGSRILLIALLLAVLSSCGERKPLKTSAKATPMPPEQKACFDNVIKKRLEFEQKNIDKQMAELKEQRSTINTVIEERRMNEAFCYEEAQCWKLDEFSSSFVFASCLKHAEQSY